jgi:hypothetical protein
VITLFNARVRLVQIQQKEHRDTLHGTRVFASVRICGPCSAFRCVWGAKCRHIFMLGWARCSFHKKCTRTPYVQLVFLHPVGFASHVVHSGASRNVIVLLFMLGWDQYGFDKKHLTSYAEFVFLHLEGSMGHIVHSGATEVRNGVGTIFHAWVGPVRIRQKAHWDTLHFSCVFTSRGI